MTSMKKRVMSTVVSLLISMLARARVDCSPKEQHTGHEKLTEIRTNRTKLHHRDNLTWMINPHAKGFEPFNLLKGGVKEGSSSLEQVLTRPIFIHMAHYLQVDSGGLKHIIPAIAQLATASPIDEVFVKLL